jgi:hypothetical protein
MNSQYRNSNKPDPYARFRQMTALNRHRRGGISSANQEMMLKLYAMQLEQNAKNDKLAVGLTVGTKAAEALTATTVAMTTAISDNRDRRATAEDYSRRLDASLEIERIRAAGAVGSAATAYGYGSGRQNGTAMTIDDFRDVCSACSQTDNTCGCNAQLTSKGLSGYSSAMIIPYCEANGF